MFDAELSELDSLSPSSLSPASDEARATVHARMRGQAREAPARLAEWIQSVDPTDTDNAMRLGEVYEALAPEAATLEAFFLAEFNRLLSVCEAHPKSKPAFSALGALMFLEGHSPESLRRAARARLALGLRSSVASIRRACVDLLGGHDVGRDAATRAAVEACLCDSDWKVRTLAESTLSDAGLLPANYRIPLVDRLRRKIGSWTDYV